VRNRALHLPGWKAIFHSPSHISLQLCQDSKDTVEPKNKIVVKLFFLECVKKKYTSKEVTFF
jgi:hypothetical protein